jgi:hypothetical protein
MLGDPQMLVRRLREGKEFFSYLQERHERAERTAKDTAVVI